MTAKDLRRLRIGQRVGEDLTVLGHVDRQKRNPIYIVWHRRAWCPMACKVFRSPARAKREADILSSFSHPNTVRFLGLAKPAAMLMEFLEGPTLDTVIETRPAGRMRLSDALRVGVHIGAALQHVHDRGFLHLDVKPGNVIVERGKPVLFDFGSARRQGAKRPRRIAGTDPYIAPEECEKGEATRKSDVFSLGATLYEMLTGELPFPECTKRKPFPQLASDPKPLRDHVRSLPKTLDDLLLSCLGRTPEARPSLNALLPELNALIRSGPRMWPESFKPPRNRS